MWNLLNPLQTLTFQVAVFLDEDVHLLQGFLQRARLTRLRAREVAVHHGSSRRHDAEREQLEEETFEML